MSEEHGNLIKSPKQLVVMVFASFFVPLIIIAFLMVYVGSGKNKGADAEAANHLIKPVAMLDFKDASGPKVFKTGEEIYKQACASCHASGAAGAPKFGDAGGWSARLGRGYDGLLTSLVKGKGAMPARGGTSASDISDYELGRAVVYLAASAGGKFPEPKAPEVKAEAKAEAK
ncbi:cytochrome c [Polynucleobacter sp. 30F-ANTBAC]|jgi:cytochrome c5|uniref:c-type cytochrome n=1 Tax=Polynucleobacter sp. 30F-ANTBAC TaxID=2689095 RepID=UPI001C0DA086|nr:cytochrome c [Polynucleobacter sp. 30F-ANTBAC]MBU3599990.1 cytochrome c [Polynucleobacter sp. 30F-ANTBAC]